MFINRYLAAATFALGTLFAVTGASAQVGPGGPPPMGRGGLGPMSMFQDLIGEWNNTGSGAAGGYSITVRRNGDVWQQGAPMARVADTISAGGNFAFEGSYPPPDNRIFRCVYYVTFLAGNTRASFRLVDQSGTGPGLSCAQGVFERVAEAGDLANSLAKTGKVDIYGILFDIDKTALKPESKRTLEEVAKLLRTDPSLKLEVAGHTDNTGGAAHNMRLSAGRAASVVHALVDAFGIEEGRLRAIGYGDTKPVAPNDSDQGRAQNRRVELRKL
jgi:outer membrane protein OmpA-like peptidoglycan-associated protein